jgi:alpha-glucosidase
MFHVHHTARFMPVASGSDFSGSAEAGRRRLSRAERYSAQKNSFAPIFNRPMSLGTGCHQLAMYVVYEAPLQMLSDSPSNYLREPEVMEYLAAVPTEWDETKALDGRISEYVAVARRNGSDWYVGAMSNWTPRELKIDFSFLPEGTFWMDAYQDGVNAERYACDYKKTRSQVSR